MTFPTKRHYSKKKAPLSRGDARRAEGFVPKIAIIHDYIKEYGGAEAVLETLIDTFPQADVFTSLYFPSFFGPHRARFEAKLAGKVHTSFLQLIPFAHKIISPLRLLSPLAFKSFNFSDYDIIISSATGAYFPNSLHKKNARLICYCHTPPRYLYGLPTARNFQNNPIFRPIINLMNHFLRLADFKYSQNVDQYLANSATTADRIQKYYRRDAIVINPPIDLPNIKNKAALSREDVDLSTGGFRFFLTGGRLARAKRYDVAIEACKLLNLPLKIFGRDFAGYESELRSISSSKTEFLGEITPEKKAQLFTEARAFIFCSDNEDFGMIPVEAMAYGCPVIAYKSGGVTETVIDGQTGVFFNELTANSCATAIRKFQKLKINSQDCINRAKDFSKEKFVEKIKKLIS